MKMRPIALAIAAVALTLLAVGVWLWSRVGLAVWLDAAVAFCT